MTTHTLHEGLQALRDDRASHPAAVSAVSRLAAGFGTPLYVYDKAAITGQFRALKAAFAPRFPKLRLHYALKANGSVAIGRILRAEGAFPEVVSLGEILTALRAGWSGPDVLFTSSSKTPDEITKTIELGAVLNADSRDELEQASAAAVKAGRTVRLSFRLNPGVDPDTLHHINTGIPESKFGVHLDGGDALAAYARAKELPGVAITGIHCHIGSQIADTAGYEKTARKMLAFAKELKEKLGIVLEFVDLGGGIGVPYKDGETVMSPETLAAALEPIWKDGVAAAGYEPALWLEPGRSLVAPSGFLITRVNTVKTTPLKTFVNVDAGSNTLLRPALYGAYHRARIVSTAPGAPRLLDVAGDVCETGDILAEERTLPLPKAGDHVVFLDAGAYGFAMASVYNARPLPAEVLVDGDAATLIRRRGTYDGLFRDEVSG
ncbi:MAG: diaminopimelate decarboxylase [Acidobacteria bacterium]|nr:diaminopimelate decarboxylase [Acidobacteriota bacterium]MBK9963843.1 diaminopimelate decarboxylase [Holophagales bacterium]